MPRQQTRSSGEGAIDPSLVQKKRARHRLVGALCVCLIAAVVVPLVLESEPKPQRDVPMEIAVAAASSGTSAGPEAAVKGGPADLSGPGKGATASGSIGTSATGGAPDLDSGAAQSKSTIRSVTPPEVAPSAIVAPPARSGTGHGATADPRPTAAATPKSEAKAHVKAEARTEPRIEPKVPARAEPKSESRSAAHGDTRTQAPRSDEPDVLARLIDRANTSGGAKSAAATGVDTANRVDRKFLVQIGAFSNVQSARNVSDKAVRAGLRPYQETVKTAQGDWIRVRVGPFATRQDAERAQQDLKRAGVTAAIIAL